LPTSLVELGVDESSIEQLATEAAQQWTGQFNPVPLTTETATRIYESLF
jgi:alcohol dehydrogenase